jgi:mono/diheme cytochrome c family protein
MYTPDAAGPAALLFVLCAVAQAQDAPELGVPVNDAAVRDIDFTVMPDGEGLPDGSGTVAAGADVYRRNCLACHGEYGTGGINDELAGGQGSLATGQPNKTIGSYWPYASTLFSYIRRAMPYPEPGSLSDDETYSVAAYLLYLNGLIDEDSVMDKENLPVVEMPNRDGFDRQ